MSYWINNKQQWAIKGAEENYNLRFLISDYKPIYDTPR